MPQILEREILQEQPETTHAYSAEPRAGRTRKRRTLWICAVVAIILIGGAAWRLYPRPAESPYRPANVGRGTIAKTISATGRLQALTTVQVGTQISGTVSEIYVDFNSPVKKGQVIARLDPSQVQAQLTQASANLAGAQASVATAQSAQVAAEAGIQSAEANVARVQSVADDAQRNLDRTRELVAEGVGAKKDLDSAQATLAQAAAQKQQAVAQLNQARAQAQSARSQLDQARAQATQAGASVELASVNMEHTVIKAPIDGIIVSRNVDVGQTVAASLQAPTLFLVANDLRRMQVLADIDEADVGQLHPESRVTFTVDAYPVETFDGRISQIRLAPQTVQNVVTYTAVIDVENPALKLKPGMTANVTAIVAEQPNALTVPAAALRFRPEGVPAAAPRAGTGTVYRIQDKQLEPVTIRTGLNDGTAVQVVSGNLREGDQVATPAQSAERKTAQAPRAGGMFGMGAGRPAGRVR